MAKANEQKALRAVKDAQAKFEREQAKAQASRRKAFTAAQEAGLSLRQIGDAVDLHHTRVLQIIRGE
jgi:hypothetical protein